MLWITAVSIRSRADRRVVMLLAFSIPILILIPLQALISRTHGAWTASIAAALFIKGRHDDGNGHKRTVAARKHRRELLALSFRTYTDL